MNWIQAKTASYSALEKECKEEDKLAMLGLIDPVWVSLKAGGHKSFCGHANAEKWSRDNKDKVRN